MRGHRGRRAARCRAFTSSDACHRDIIVSPAGEENENENDDDDDDDDDMSASRVEPTHSNNGSAVTGPPHA
jgi:hypothetical protein